MQRVPYPSLKRSHPWLKQPMVALSSLLIIGFILTGCEGGPSSPGSHLASLKPPPTASPKQVDIVIKPIPNKTSNNQTPHVPSLPKVVKEQTQIKIALAEDIFTSWLLCYLPFINTNCTWHLSLWWSH